MRNLFLFCFIILLGTQANAQELRQLRVSGKAKKLDGEMVARRDINGDYAAAIQIITILEGLSYDSWDGMVGDVEAKPGQDMVFVTHRERVLEIYALGYQKLQLTLSEIGIHLKPREVWQITITGDAPPAATLPVTIRFTPADATLSIDGQPTGKTGTHSLTPGNHTLKIEKEGYKTEEKTITVSEQQVFFEYALQRQPDAGLQIETTPAGATVYLDGVSLGQSPVAAFFKPGTYPIRIVKEGYVTIENQTLEVALPQTRKSYTLEENVGWLTINTHSGASVYFNDQLIANPKNVKLPPQLVRVKVTMPKAEPLEQQVILKRNDRLTFDMFPTVQTGTIQIAVTPFDATIELTGDAGEKYTAVGMQIFEDIQVGTYTIKVTAGGHQTAQETLTLRQGSRETRSIKLSESAPATSYEMTAPNDLNSGLKADTKENEKQGVYNDKRDGKTYKWAQIGKQTWMIENLNYSAPGSYCYENQEANCRGYGRLYEWEAALYACPDGWKLPDENDWRTLVTFYGGVYRAYNHLISNNRPEDFHALFAGYFSESQTQVELNQQLANYKRFSSINQSTHFWTSTVCPGIGNNRVEVSFSHQFQNISITDCSTFNESYQNTYNKFMQFNRRYIYIKANSVRCIKI